MLGIQPRAQREWNDKNAIMVRRNLEASLAERRSADPMKRQPCWTEGLAVGSAEFVRKLKPLILSRLEMETTEVIKYVFRFF
jgi:hypothetical protein